MTDTTPKDLCPVCGFNRSVHAEAVLCSEHGQPPGHWCKPGCQYGCEEQK